MPERFVGEDDLSLTNGMKLDDPEIIQAHQKLMDWVVPMMTEYGAWGIVLMNESDNHAKDNPLSRRRVSVLFGTRT